MPGKDLTLIAVPNLTEILAGSDATSGGVRDEGMQRGRRAEVHHGTSRTSFHLSSASPSAILTSWPSTNPGNSLDAHFFFFFRGRISL